jgi:adenosylhomocysteine nucleosidase
LKKEPHLLRIVILTATKIEFNAIARAFSYPRKCSYRGYSGLSSTEPNCHALLIKTGMGPQRARTVARELLDSEQWDLMVSTGFGGALQEVPIGTVIIGEGVKVSQPDREALTFVACHSGWLKKMSALRWPGQVPRNGFLMTVGRVLTFAKEKQALGAQTGAVAVDMESGAIGLEAQQSGVPFLIIRTISDGYREDLPLDFHQFKTYSGWLREISHCVLSPSCFQGLYRLFGQSRQASKELTLFFRAFFSYVSSSISDSVSTSMVS